MPQLIYICSSAHGGSTLLDLLLGAHPRIFSLGEITNEFTDYMKRNELCTCQLPLHACPVWLAVRNKLLEDLSLDIFQTPEELPISETLLWRQGPVLLQRLAYYQKLFLAYAGQPGLLPFEVKFLPHAPRSVHLTRNLLTLYKTVSEVAGYDILVDSSKSALRMKWVFMLNPAEVKVIYLVRDGRGVMASHMRKGRSAKSAVRSWLHQNVQTRRLLRHLPKEAWILSRYEDLCADPTAELARICRFIGVPFHEQMLKFRQVEHHDVGGNRMRFGTEEKIVNTQGWRKRLSEHDIQLFEAKGGHLNQQLGYE